MAISMLLKTASKIKHSQVTYHEFSSFSRLVRFEGSLKLNFQPKIGEQKILVHTMLKKRDKIVIFLEASYFKT